MTKKRTAKRTKSFWKKCNRCNETRWACNASSKSYFRKNAQYKDGYFSTCKPCISETESRVEAQMNSPFNTKQITKEPEPLYGDRFTEILRRAREDLHIKPCRHQAGRWIVTNPVKQKYKQILTCRDLFDLYFNK